MKILVLETDRRASDDAVAALTAAGHDVLRCHDRDHPAFPCRALCDDGDDCALDGWVDVALTVRAHPYPRPTPSEDGVTCAIRHHIPLVVAGTPALNPFAKWTTDVADSDNVVEVCEAAAAAPLRDHSRLATAEARRLIELEGLSPDAVGAVAHRAAGRILVDVTVPPEADRRLGDVMAVRIAGVVRALDAYAGVIDVRVQSA